MKMTSPFRNTNVLVSSIFVSWMFVLIYSGSPTLGSPPPTLLSCYDVYQNPPLVNCDPSSTSGRTSCFLLCGFCVTPELRLGLGLATNSSIEQFLCTPPQESASPLSSSAIISYATQAISNVSAIQGTFWLNDSPSAQEGSAMACLQALISGMPKRDMMLLFRNPMPFIDFLNSHIRTSLSVRQQWPPAQTVPWQIFLDNVLPYAFLDEPRDIEWNWRLRFNRLFSATAFASSSLTSAAEAISNKIPSARLGGVLALGGDGGAVEFVTGNGIVWHSSTSPAFLSPKTVSENGGSCTGTAIVLAAAWRSVGIPARVTGCSQSIVIGDDHHWVEFWDNSTRSSPMSDNWHTKEGVSVGNEGGPWDSLSGPMRNCLLGVVPFSRISNLYSTAWTSSYTFPLLWSNDAKSEEWGTIRGVSRCGAYCSQWGCGSDGKGFWSDAECAATPVN